MASGRASRSPVVLEARSKIVRYALVVVVAAGAMFAAYSLLGPVIGTLVSLAVIAVLGVFLGPRVMTQIHWEPADLHLASNTFRLGEEIPFTYERTSRRVTDVAPGELILQLSCTERVQWTEGFGDNESTETETLKVVDIAWRYALVPTADGIQSTGAFVVPLDVGAPSLKLRHNEVFWELVVRCDGEGLPVDGDNFDVLVVAELAPGIAMQDTIDQ